MCSIGNGQGIGSGRSIAKSMTGPGISLGAAQHLLAFLQPPLRGADHAPPMWEAFSTVTRKNQGTEKSYAGINSVLESYAKGDSPLVSEMKTSGLRLSPMAAVHHVILRCPSRDKCTKRAFCWSVHTRGPDVPTRDEVNAFFGEM